MKNKKPQLLSVQIARTEDDRVQGLMDRDTLAPYQGMLFDFGREEQTTMWMRDTKIPLDMIFFDSHREAKYIYRNATPYSESWIQCPVPVHYVLELPAGDAEKYGLKVGSHFEVK